MRNSQIYEQGRFLGAVPSMWTGSEDCYHKDDACLDILWL